MSRRERSRILGCSPDPRGGLPSAVAAAILIAGCGDGDGAYPSRDWSGRYATTVAEAATDCRDAAAPPLMTGFILVLEHSRSNRVMVTMNPVIRLAGEFRGDGLEARHLVQEPVALPDSILARATEADSIDLITYELRADFRRSGFTGRYVIRAPDLRALVLDGKGSRCEFRYRLTGQRIREAAPRAAPPVGSPPPPDTITEGPSAPR